MLKGPMDLSEVQDFSMAKKPSNISSGASSHSAAASSSANASFAHGKGKLDDMLTKLMKKNNFVSIVFKIEFLFHCVTDTLNYVVFFYFLADRGTDIWSRRQGETSSKIGRNCFGTVGC